MRIPLIPALIALNLAAPAAFADCTFMLNFETASFAISPANAALLDKVVANYPDAPMRITGHTDAVGGPEINIPLSKNRATAVLNYILTHGGTRAQIVSVQGKSETDLLVASNGAEVRNRRVELVVPGCDPEVIAGNAAPPALGTLGAGAAVGVLGLVLLGVLADGSNGTTASSTTGGGD